MESQPVLIGGRWRAADATETFQAHNPATQQPLPPRSPVSGWSDCDAALQAASVAAEAMRQLPGERVAGFPQRYAEQIEARKDEIVEMAHAETALPVSPRLADVELPRTTDQLRQAAAAARDGGWALPTIDTKLNIRSCYVPIGPVCVLGPNNFPLAFGSISGGDFAAAVAAGNPVIAKANSSHPGTTQRFAEAAQAAAEDAGMPAGTVQLLYRVDHADGERLVADPRLGATGYTGSRQAGLALKAAADAAGKPIYLELSAVNPVLILPGALDERLEEIADQLVGSCLLGSGQFCTSPGLILLLAGEQTERFIRTISAKLQAAPVGTLLSAGVARSLSENVKAVQEAGATLLVGGEPGGGAGYAFANTLLRTSGQQFCSAPGALQTEMFGNASLVVVANDSEELAALIDRLEGSLTGCVYSDTGGADDALYDVLAPRLAEHVGRLLNDKMPTGVAVSPAMNHGGPYPATGHPGFTAVGIPAALRRFAALRCYDNVRRPERLPPCLRDNPPGGPMWRLVDGDWIQSCWR
jgi:NADP-dependent aldehyde dehydrogenase